MDTPQAPVPTATDAETTATPVATPGSDRAAGSLVGALVVGLMLIVPVRLAMTTTTYNGLYGWMLGGIAAAVLIGLILRALQVPNAIGLVLTTAGFVAVATVVGLVLAAKAGMAGDSDGTLALLVGVPTAAVVAPLAALALRWAREPVLAGLAGSLLCFVGFMIAGAFGPTAFDMVDDARDGAADAAKLEAAGLTAYLPDIPEMQAEYTGTNLVLVEGIQGVSGYDLSFTPEGTSPDDYRSSTVDVDATRAGGPSCQPVEGYTECVEGDGYVITVHDGVEEMVTAELSDIRLTARLNHQDGKLPNLDTVGAALADAEEVDVETLVRLN